MAAKLLTLNRIDLGEVNKKPNEILLMRLVKVGVLTFHEKSLRNKCTSPKDIISDINRRRNRLILKSVQISLTVVNGSIHVSPTVTPARKSHRESTRITGVNRTDSFVFRTRLSYSYISQNYSPILHFLANPTFARHIPHYLLRRCDLVSTKKINN